MSILDIYEKVMSLINDSILRSAMASKLAYTDNVQRWVKGCCNMNMRRLQTDMTRAHICVTGENALTISFRGSQGLKDIGVNFDIRKNVFRYRQHKAKVHNGFMKMFHSVESAMTPIIDDARTVTFCGHSMGGAVACIAAAYYGSMYNKNKHIICHTFASPVVGDTGFCDWFNESVNESKRVVLNGDIVPFIPLIDYNHVCDPIVLDLWKPYKQPFLMHDLDTYLEALCVTNSNIYHQS